jgi:hypothetical protein
MHAKDFLVNDRGDRETIETVGECLPQFHIVSPLAFIIKPVNSIYTRTFMVSAKQKEILRVLDLRPTAVKGMRSRKHTL